MKQEEVQKRYIEILQERLPKRIDSDFVKHYYGKINQAKLGMKDLDEFEDALLMNGLAGIDCTVIDFSALTQEEFENFPFDSSTIFSAETVAQFKPKEILERGKDFGLGLKSIPLTGKGVHVSIRDENCNPYLTDANVVDYTRIRNGKTFKEVDKNTTEHMHGKTTTSLLASKSCGVAKDSALHFFNGSIEEYVQYIIDYNQKCEQKDKILVASGSWRDHEFTKHKDALKAVGCELICANNFDENFNEFTSNGGNIQVPLEFSQEELENLIEKYPDREMLIRTQAGRKDNIKIPISRTYHQVGENGGFKYQSAYSTSWGIPQVAGLYAIFKEMDRDLTFEQFCETARKTAEGTMRIINPQGIYREIKRSLEEKNMKKSGLDDCMQDDKVRFSTEQNATKSVKKAVLNRKLNEMEEQRGE